MAARFCPNISSGLIRQQTNPSTSVNAEKDEPIWQNDFDLPITCVHDLLMLNETHAYAVIRTELGKTELAVWWIETEQHPPQRKLVPAPFSTIVIITHPAGCYVPSH